MKYVLRNKKKVSESYSDTYLQDHVIRSLDEYCSNCNELIDIGGCCVTKARNVYPIIYVNDVADDDCMLKFVLLGITDHNILNIIFLEREKC